MIEEKTPNFGTPQTDPDELRNLLGLLYPVATPFPLIRLGPETDGGYLVPDDLVEIEECFSPGVSNESGFELDCARRGMRVYMADASVKGPAVEHEKFIFDQKFIGAYSEGAWLGLGDWVELRARSAHDLLLQMDIEGFEYEALLSISTTVLQRFRILVIEFHNLDQMFGKQMFLFYRRVFDRLIRHFHCVHIHPNNYAIPVEIEHLQIAPIAEFTFLRRDRCGSTQQFATDFPHPLDRDNIAGWPVVVLPASMRYSPRSQKAATKSASLSPVTGPARFERKRTF